MRSLLSVTGLCLIASLLASCSSTKVLSAWRNPAAEPPQFQKIIALVVSDELSVRRSGERELCKNVTETCVPANAVIPDDEVRDTEKAKRRVHDNGFDGAVILRIVGEREEITDVPPSYTPPVYAGNMWGYYGYGWGATYSPGYTRTDTFVRVETMIYSVTSSELLWVGLSETMNPKSVPDLIDDVARAVAKEMKKAGLVVS